MFTEDDIPEPSRTGRARWHNTRNAPYLGNADSYMLTHLKSAANWLQTRSASFWAKEGHQSELMMTYGETLNCMAAKLEKVIAAETMPAEEAMKIAVGEDGRDYVGTPGPFGEDKLTLDGQFNVEQLRACIALLNAKEAKK